VGGLRGRRVTPDEYNEDYHVVKEEADVAMEDVAPPSGGDLPLGARDQPPVNQALVAGGYDEEALLQ
jgi:hypothetical protein